VLQHLLYHRPFVETSLLNPAPASLTVEDVIQGAALRLHPTQHISRSLAPVLPAPAIPALEERFSEAGQAHLPHKPGSLPCPATIGPNHGRTDHGCAHSGPTTHQNGAKPPKNRPHTGLRGKLLPAYRAFGEAIPGFGGSPVLGSSLLYLPASRVPNRALGLRPLSTNSTKGLLEVQSVRPSRFSRSGLYDGY